MAVFSGIQRKVSICHFVVLPTLLQTISEFSSALW